MFWSTLSITVSFISVFVGDTCAVCSWSGFTPHVYISGFLSCSPVPAPDTPGHLFGVGFDWEAALGDTGVSPPSRSGALFSFHHVLCCPDSWKLESTGKCTRHHQFSSAQFSHSVMSDSLWPHELQHARPPCPSPTPGVHSNSCPWSQWCHPVISSSVIPFSSCPQFVPASESFSMSQLFAWGGQSTGVSALASFHPKNTQD